MDNTKGVTRASTFSDQDIIKTVQERFEKVKEEKKEG